MTNALTLLQAGHDVTVWSTEAPGTTSFNAYAVWTPVQVAADPRIERWGFETFSRFEQLALTPDCGVRLTSISQLQVVQQEPWYTDKIPCFRHARPGEVAHPYCDSHILDGAPVIDPTLYLPWLRAQIIAAGGSFVSHEVIQLTDCPAEYGVIVNCTALGAKQLCNDTEFQSHVMQFVTISNRCGLEGVVFDGDGPNQFAHVIPHNGYIKLGTSHDYSGSMTVADEMTVGILERCSRIAPELEVSTSDILSVGRCARPKRALIRVESEKLSDGRLIIHNYGHDGKAYIVSFGIAAEISKMISAI
jgi:D-amino-acid oxidase